MSGDKLVVILHGAYGNPSENWFPWLRDQLVRQGIEAKVPELPTPEHQTLENWTRILNENVDGKFSELILVGHSASCAFILRWIESVPTPIRGAFLVSSFVRDLGLKEFDSINNQFYREPFDWDSIRANCRTFEVFHSDNDPYVPMQRGQEIAKHLNVTVKVVKTGGHINTAAGYTEFSALLGDILKTFRAR